MEKKMEQSALLAPTEYDIVEECKEQIINNVNAIIKQRDCRGNSGTIADFLSQGWSNEVFGITEVISGIVYLDRIGIVINTHQCPENTATAAGPTTKHPNDFGFIPFGRRNPVSQNDAELLFVVAVHLSCKYMQDDPFTTSSFSKISGFPSWLLVKIEVLLIGYLSCNLSVSEESWATVYRMLLASPSGARLPSPLESRRHLPLASTEATEATEALNVASGRQTLTSSCSYTQLPMQEYTENLDTDSSDECATNESYESDSADIAQESRCFSQIPMSV